MSTRTSRWPAGVPCWADLSVPDVPAALAFYADVLGWESGPEQEGGYRICGRNGVAAGGVGPLQMPGQPPAWTLYFASDDADATARAVSEHGGSVLVGTGQVGEAGRMAVVADPAGAVFGVWEAGQHIGAGLVNEPGGLVWEDLRSTDPEGVAPFYSAVLGHRFEPMDGMDGYWTFTAPGEDAPCGGIGGMMGAPDGTPSHWLPYFQVEDVDDAVETAVENGATAPAPAFDTPFGRMAPLVDPFGAVLWLMSTPVDADQASPDRSG